MPNIRALNKKKYEINRYRYHELRYFCLQYPEWVEELKKIEGVLKSIDLTREGKAGRISDATADLAIRREGLGKKCELIEQTAIEADGEIYQYILKGVTMGKGFDRLFPMPPCERDMYYDRRRKFFHLLSKKV